ncbi:hypothetical protein T4A_3841 [Trichinella pseudospiralis]|uniref:Uncharacterized protein n=1 Tax=Trichinella pseudospiralis TaxID=6337 RepID=A0A0V1ALR6_TRIPS|nr:hypothetical protein T4A_3841 [Trichinella pseudospiralis]
MLIAFEIIFRIDQYPFCPLLKKQHFLEIFKFSELD